MRKPIFHIWVPCQPKASQKRSQSSLRTYKQRIRKAAEEVIPFPVKSPRIEISVIFNRDRAVGPDVDNILKPIMDALKGVAYFDDNQVRGVRVLALPNDDAIAFDGWIDKASLDYLSKVGTEEGFLIQIYEGRGTSIF